MVRHRLERLMRLTQGAALVAVAACNSNESKPGEAITNEALRASATPSAMMPTINAVATPPTASAAAPVASAEATPVASAEATPLPSTSASASASAATSAAAPPPAKPTGGQVGPLKPPIHVNSPPIRVNSPNHL